MINRDHSFCGMWNFQLSHGICRISTEFLYFCVILYWPMVNGQIQHNWSGLGGRRKSIKLHVDMIAAWNTWLPLELSWEEYWTTQLKYCLLFGRQAICQFHNLPTTNTAYWVGWVQGLQKILCVDNLLQWTTELGKLASGIWRNLPQTTVASYVW